MIGLKKRSDEFEIMDDMTMEGRELRRTLDLLSSINHWLGGNSLTLDGVGEILKGHDKDKPVRIVDLGCGNGDMLRHLQKYREEMGYRFELLGVDANPASIAYAQ